MQKHEIELPGGQVLVVISTLSRDELLAKLKRDKPWLFTGTTS